MSIFYGVVSIIGGFLVHLTLGTGNTFGNMSPYITSYIRFVDGNSNISARDIAWMYAVASIGHGLLITLGGVIGDRIGPRVTAFAGCFIASGGVALSYFSIKSSVTLLTVTYGFLWGFGIGTAYVSPLSAAMMWFPNHKGLVNGIIVSGFGLGPFVFSQMQTMYINPENIAPTKEGYFMDYNLLKRIPNVFLLLASIYSVLQLVGCTLLTRPNLKREKKSLIPETETVPQVITGTTDPNNIESSVYQYGTLIKSKGERVLPTTHCFTPIQMLKCRQFYILWITYFLNNQTVFFLNTMYKAYGQTFISDDKFLAMVGAVASLTSAVGRIMWGLFCDRTNYKVSMLGVTSGICIFIATLSLTPYGGKIMFAAWIAMIGFALAGNFVLFPTITTHTFGMKHAGINYALVFSNTVIASPLGAIMWQNLLPSFGWAGMQGLMAFFAGLAFLVTLFFKPIA